MDALLHNCLEPVSQPDDAVEVGRVLDPWGVKGWLRIQPYSAEPEVLLSARRWWLLPPDRGAAAFSQPCKVRVKECKEHSDGLVARFEDLESRNAAQLLKGARICVPRSSFPTAQTDEYYWVDLLGLEVVNRAAQAMGVVKDLLSTGPQTVLVLAYEAEGKAQERLIPFVSAYVDSVDLAARRIVVDWQADY
ncbi:MAG: ribosome maturation factor RimM [Rhodoferax sp.]